MAGQILHTVNRIIVRNVRLCSNAPVIRSVHDGEGLLKRKMTNILQWYEEVTGMHEVRLAQNRVLEAEEKFVTAQEKRREANNILSGIQSKLKDLYAELDTTTRGEDRYVHLITQEHKMLKEERKAVQEFQRYEREERDYFAALSSAVKDSHEKERAQAERTKYWSIIGSIIGTIIGVIGSSINNELKMKELRRLVKESLERKDVYDVNVVPDVLSKHERELSDILNQMKNIASLPTDQFIGQLKELVHNLDNKTSSGRNDSVIQTNELLKCLEQLDTNMDRRFEQLKSVLYKHVDLGDNQVVMLPLAVEEILLKQQQKTQLIVASCTVFALTIPLLCKYFGML